MQLSDLSQPPLVALSKLVGLLAMPNLTDVVCNGPDLWFADVGSGLRRLPNFSVSANELIALARTLVDLGDRHLDIANPITDVSLHPQRLMNVGGFEGVFEPLVTGGIERLRVHAVLQSAISATTMLSIRAHRSQAFRLDQLADSGGWSPAQFEAVKAIAHERQNVLVSGPAGSGKTTLLRAFLLEQPSLRTIVVEDTAELLPCGPAAVGLQVRQSNQEGAGFLPLRELTRQALRMRPDRIVVGEIRGSEVLELLKAMSTGHSGSAGTVHANSAEAVRLRLSSLLFEAGMAPDLGFDFIQSAVQALVHLNADRSIAYVGELT